jgi:hypothetical protein
MRARRQIDAVQRVVHGQDRRRLPVHRRLPAGERLVGQHQHTGRRAAHREVDRFRRVARDRHRVGAPRRGRREVAPRQEGRRQDGHAAPVERRIIEAPDARILIRLDFDLMRQPGARQRLLIGEDGGIPRAVRHGRQPGRRGVEPRERAERQIPGHAPPAGRARARRVRVGRVIPQGGGAPRLRVGRFEVEVERPPLRATDRREADRPVGVIGQGGGVERPRDEVGRRGGARLEVKDERAARLPAIRGPQRLDARQIVVAGHKRLPRPVCPHDGTHRRAAGRLLSHIGQVVRVGAGRREHRGDAEQIPDARLQRVHGVEMAPVVARDLRIDKGDQLVVEPRRQRVVAGEQAEAVDQVHARRDQPRGARRRRLRLQEARRRCGRIVVGRRHRGIVIAMRLPEVGQREDRQQGQRDSRRPGPAAPQRQDGGDQPGADDQ